MSTSPDAQFTQANMVRFERAIHAPAAAIWPVLTDTARLPGWYGDGRVDAAARGATVEPRESYMKRNAERYGVDLSKLPK